MTQAGDVTITLTSDEALVLFDLMHRWECSERVNPPSTTQNRLPSGICPRLERELQEPFEPDYAELVAAARQRLAPKG